MNKLKKYIEVLVIFLIIIIVSFGIIIYKLNKRNSEKVNEVTQGEGDVEVEYSTEKVRDANQFFSIQNCIQKNINENFTAKDMNILDGDYIMNFAVFGEILEPNANTAKDVYYIFRMDSENDTFMIEDLEEGKYNDINDIKMDTDITKIDSNGNNTMEYITITDEQISRMYFEKFSKLELNNPEKAYDLLDEDYRNERFPTLDDYKEYVNAYKNIISTGSLSKYARDIKDDYTECVLVDNYNNYYTMKETSIMNYTVMLDNYTIKTSDYSEKYQELDDEDKVQANVHIFLQMINTKDYKHIYNILDDTFKQKNFNTLEKFKQYVQKNFFEYNLNSSISSEKSIERQGEYYIYKTVVRDNSGSAAEKKEITIVMKLVNETDFVMSFSI